MKTHIHVLIMTIDGNGQLRAVLRHPGEISLENKQGILPEGDDLFTASGELRERESCSACVERLLFTQLDLLPSHIMQKWQPPERLSPYLLGEDDFYGERRMFFAVLLPFDSLRAVRLRASSGGLTLMFKSEIPESFLSKLGPEKDIFKDCAGPQAIRKAFEIFAAATTL